VFITELFRGLEGVYFTFKLPVQLIYLFQVLVSDQANGLLAFSFNVIRAASQSQQVSIFPKNVAVTDHF